MKKLSGLSAGHLLLASSIGFLCTSAGLGQSHTVGMIIQKSCPTTAVAGSTFQCTVVIQNQDPEHALINFSVTNTVPSPGGTTSAVPCLQGDVPVTTLGPLGTQTDTCSGSASETAPPCGSTDTMLVDRVAASGTDEVVGVQVSGSTQVAVLISACTPTPAPPTNTPTPTITPTPTQGPPPLPTQVPTHAGRPPTKTPNPTKTPKP